jgi:hypothetical protein
MLGPPDGWIGAPAGIEPKFPAYWSYGKLELSFDPERPHAMHFFQIEAAGGFGFRFAAGELVDVGVFKRRHAVQLDGRGERLIGLVDRDQDQFAGVGGIGAGVDGG